MRERKRCFASGNIDLNCGWVGCNEAVGTSKENTYERWCTASNKKLERLLPLLNFLQKVTKLNLIFFEISEKLFDIQTSS